MNQICYQCKSLFNESSIQYYRREKDKLPILCQDCYRLCKAESRSKERVNKENISKEVLSYQKSIEKKIKNLIKLYGKISVPLVMRSLKVSSEEAAILCLSQELKKN